MRNCTIVLALLAMVMFAGAANAGTIVDTTDFDSTNPGDEMPLTDGQATGFNTPFDIAGAGDTMAGWTWYTEDAANEAPTAGDVVNTISIPYDGGTETVGEQVIRSASNSEIDFDGGPTSRFSFRWGTYNASRDDAIALRRTFTGVGAGTTNVDWEDNTLGGFFAYYSQDGGSNWTALTDDADFTATAADLDILFVGNDGADSSSLSSEGLQSVTVSYQAIPEPSSICLLVAGLLGVIGLRRRR